MGILKKINTDNKDLNQVQENVDKAIETFNNNPLLMGRFKENITLYNGVPYQVEHGLKRPVLGYIIIKKSGVADIYDSSSSIPSKTIILTSNADVVISLYVF